MADGIDIKECVDSEDLLILVPIQTSVGLGVRVIKCGDYNAVLSRLRDLEKQNVHDGSVHTQITTMYGDIILSPLLSDLIAEMATVVKEKLSVHKDAVPELEALLASIGKRAGFVYTTNVRNIKADDIVMTPHNVYVDIELIGERDHVTYTIGLLKAMYVKPFGWKPEK